MESGIRPRVVVLGDSVLDLWMSGTSHRLCREGAAPVVDVDELVTAPGAAANTAANIAALGCDVDLVSVVGDDDIGDALTERLRQCGVGVDHVVRAGGRTTPSKQRVLAAEHVLLRLDQGGVGTVSADDIALVARRLAVSLKNADGLVISAYSRSFAGARVMAVLRRLRAGLPLVVVDSHDLMPWRSLYPDLVTPNQSEASALLTDCGSCPPGPGRARFFNGHRRRLTRATGADTVVVTLDCDGVLVLHGDRPLHRTRTRPAPAENCAGAGDTFTAAMTVGLIRGLSVTEAADYGQLAADVVTAQPGTSVCSAEHLDRRMTGTEQSVMSHDDLARLLGEHRRAGGRIVFTNGCFDVLHRGHVAYLNEARLAGDVLVVAINSDDGVRNLKGPDRPINTARDRAAVLAALGCVDYVTVFDGHSASPLIARLRPDIYVKGGDYSEDMLSEAPVVRGYGGEVRILGYVADHSTTEMIQRVRSTTPTEQAEAVKASTARPR